MTELQNRLLVMLKVFHKFCVENKIRYYALGGTMLGAVRHRGFIPWDDDIDVGIPRKDYERLISIRDKFPTPYLLEQPLENKDFVYSFAKLYDTTTTLIENTRYKTKRGIYLDLFPLDGIGNTYRESVANFKKIDKTNNLINTKVCAVRKGRAFYKNAAIVIGRLIPSCLFNWQKAIKKNNDICAARDFDKYEYVANVHGNWREKEISKRTTFGEPTLYKFEDMQIYGPAKADEYLRGVYNNYMQLPPEEKRHSHHDYIFLDLEKGYKDCL